MTTEHSHPELETALAELEARVDVLEGVEPDPDPDPDPDPELTRIYAVSPGDTEWSSPDEYLVGSPASFIHPDSLVIDLSQVTDPAPESVYRGEHYGNEVVLAFPVSQGTHKVRVHLAENWPGAQDVGGRVHTVEVNDEVVVDGLDVYAEVGANAAYVVEHVVESDVLTVAVRRVSGDNARLQGVEVWSSVPVPVPDDPEPDPDPDPDPDPPSDWGEFPTLLNAGWANWHLNEVPWDSPGAPAYEPPPPLPPLPFPPSDAIAVTPSTIVSEVNNRPSGTNFLLADGTYNLTIPTKAGNKYWGNRSAWMNGDYDRVIINGQRSRSVAFSGGVGGVEIYYITWERFVGDSSRGAVAPGAANWKFTGCTSRWNNGTGLRLNGSNGRIWWHRTYENGQYGLSHNARGWQLDCVEAYRNGNTDLPQGTPTYHTSDRGFTKFGQAYTQSGQGAPGVFRRIHSHDHQRHGLWFDIRIRDITVEHCWIETADRIGINFEAGMPGGGPIVCRWNRVINCGKVSLSGSWWKPWFLAVPAGIRYAVCENVHVYENVVIGIHGIGFYNWAHPQITGEASSPGSGEVNAVTMRNSLAEYNYIHCSGGRSDLLEIWAGGTQMSHGHSKVENAYEPSQNNKFRNNVYAGPNAKQFQWGHVGGSGGPRTLAEWANFGHS